MKLLLGGILAVFGGAVFFLFFYPKTAVVQNQQSGNNIQAGGVLAVPEATGPTSSAATRNGAVSDIGFQAKLNNPPEVVKALYATGWSAGSREKIDYLTNIIESRGLNAIVIDIKDYSGYVSYDTDIPEVKESGAEGELRILRPNELIKRLHDKNIYVIGRITIFQDPILAKAHPEWALKNKNTGKTWKDNRGLSWMDAAAKPVWDYNIAIAKDALNRGFDEINFDYIRFASDGDLSAIGYPFWDEKTPRRGVIKNFFAYLRERLSDAKLSVDLFGLSTIDTWDDLGIGQVIEDAYPYFDYVSPMVYPSHYASGFMGYKNPANYPYEVVKYSMEQALKRLMVETSDQRPETSSATSSVISNQSSVISYRAKLRPWLQSFDLGAVYTSSMLQKQIDAVNEVFATSTDKFGGWFLWDPANNYKSFK